jgi:hypothetical protein
MADDIETYLRERMQVFDASIETGDGSPFDVKVTQPLVRRLGVDPLSMDPLLFAETRIRQLHPGLSTEEGSVLRDILIKMWVALTDPYRREITRIKQGQSFRDPDVLTLDEAAAHGANIFSSPVDGKIAIGKVRIYFSAPQQIAVTPANQGISRSNLRFPAVAEQSITMEEMLLNVEGSYYYFDVEVQGESSGAEYNVDVGEIVRFTGVQSAVRVTNRRKFRGGIEGDDAATFISRARTEVSERSLVAEAGLRAKLRDAFPGEISRLIPVGHRDVEMSRDVIRGGSLGRPIAFGTDMNPVDDGEGRPTTRLVEVAGVTTDFVALLGGTGDVGLGYVLSLTDAFLPGQLPRLRDIPVRSVVDSLTLELADPDVDLSKSNLTWTLRRREIQLASIPGGILLPDSAGFSSIPPDEVHIGGCQDVYLSGPALDIATLTIDALTDDLPAARGIGATVAGGGVVTLGDLVLGTDFHLGDEIHRALIDAGRRGFRLVLEGNPATDGTYRVRSVTLGSSPGDTPQLALQPAPAVVAGTLRWKLVDTLTVDLVEPKNTRITGSDLRVFSGSTTVRSAGGLSFLAYGVQAGDVLRIFTGPDAGDYAITALGPYPDALQVGTPLTASRENLGFAVYQANAGGGVERPLVRITKVELLDASGQPTGTLVPYGRALGARSSAFANTATGIKYEATDARLGLVGVALLANVTTINGRVLNIKVGAGERINQADGTILSVAFAGASLSVQNIVDQINAASVLAGLGHAARVVGGNRVGIYPMRGGSEIYLSGNRTGGVYTNDPIVLQALFGSPSFEGTSRDVRSAEVTSLAGRWLSSNVRPPIDTSTDVVDVLDGINAGRSYPAPAVDGRESNGVLSVGGARPFYPDVARQIRVGARSLGTARVYFIEPTSFEVDARRTRFVAGTKVFVPDPQLQAVRIPAPPSTQAPKDGASTTGTGIFQSATGQFVSRMVQPGDELRLSFEPLIGTVALASEVTLLATQTIFVSLLGGPDIQVTFYNDDTGIAATSVTRDGVANQINEQLGTQIARINTLTNELELESDGLFVVRGTGTANVLLGLPVIDTSNEAADEGTYEVLTVASETQITVQPAFTTSDTRLRYEILRPGVQRVSATQMAESLDSHGMYSAVVELVSEGTGNVYNIADGSEMVVEEYDADGYYLSTDQPETSMSPAEQITLHISRSILEVGSGDEATNAREMTGAAVQITYERSQLVADVHSYMLSDERTLTASALGRHLIPHYVHLFVNYSGGDEPFAIEPLLAQHITQRAPDQAIEAGLLQKIFTDRGALSVSNPLDMRALVYDLDRSVRVQISEDRLTTGRLSAFFVGKLVLQR